MSSSKVGTPPVVSTVTFSEKSTVMLMTLLSALYAALVLVAETEVTAGLLSSPVVKERVVVSLIPA